MKTSRLIFGFVLFSLILAACSSAGTPAAQATPIPTVLADKSIVANGQLEPVRITKRAP